MMNVTNACDRLFSNATFLEGAVLFSFMRDMSLMHDYPLEEKDLITEEGKQLFRLINLMDSNGIEVVDTATINISVANNPDLKSFVEEYGGASEIIKNAQGVSPKNIDSYFDSLMKRNYLTFLKNKGFNIYQYADKFSEMSYDDIRDFVEFTLLTGEFTNSIMGRNLEINDLYFSDELFNEIVNGEAFEHIEFKDYLIVDNNL